MTSMPQPGVLSGPVIPVHTRVRGRVRFEVAGLYRAPALKRELERGLSKIDGVRVVQANILTGRVLVVFDAEFDMDALVALVERFLDGSPRCRTVTAKSRSRSMNFKVGSWKASAPCCGR